MNTPDFVLQHSTKIRYAWGAIDEAAAEVELLGASRVLVVCDRGIVEAGLTERLLAILEQAGIAAEVFSRISENPRDHECDDAASSAIECGAQAIVGLGGGSPMDAAKAAAALVTNGKNVQAWDFPALLEQQPLPVVCVPTTAGTGSEVTFVAVVTDTDRRYKMCVQDAKLAPKVAIVDPELTVSLPPALTASTGMDALTHAIEAYTCRIAEPITDALALAAMSLISGSLVTAVQDGSNRQARSDVMLGSVMAGIAFVNTDVGSVHCIAETLGGWYDTPHGVANAVFLPEVLEFNYPANPAKHAMVASALGVDCSALGPDEAALAGIAEIRRLSRAIGMPSFADLAGVSPSDFEVLAQAAADHICTPDNAREIGYEDYLRLFRATYAR